MMPSVQRSFKQISGYNLVPIKNFDLFVLDYLTTSKTELPISIGSINNINIEKEFLFYCLSNFIESKSQIFQDLFVQYILKDKYGGFFVEFGATNGIDLSNTFLLENKYAWRGILAEPAKTWHAQLHQNRGCIIDTRCVWTQSGGEILFNETDAPALSTINRFSKSDIHKDSRKQGKKYSVETITLNDLLSQHNAPKIIDYMSIDTEGSELDIIQSFNFNKYDVQIITIEHNYDEYKREKIHQLLKSYDYLRVLNNYSKHDDWYINTELYPINITKTSVSEYNPIDVEISTLNILS